MAQLLHEIFLVQTEDSDLTIHNIIGIYGNYTILHVFCLDNLVLMPLRTTKSCLILQCLPCLTTMSVIGDDIEATQRNQGIEVIMLANSGLPITANEVHPPCVPNKKQK